MSNEHGMPVTAKGSLSVKKDKTTAKYLKNKSKQDRIEFLFDQVLPELDKDEQEIIDCLVHDRWFVVADENHNCDCIFHFEGLDEDGDPIPDLTDVNPNCYDSARLYIKTKSGDKLIGDYWIRDTDDNKKGWEWLIEQDDDGSIFDYSHLRRFIPDSIWKNIMDKLGEHSGFSWHDYCEQAESEHYAENYEYESHEN